MEPLLMSVTIVSLVLGAAMSLVAWKLLRHQRQHSAARVEALQAMTAEPDEEPEAVEPTAARPASRAPAPPVPPSFATLEDAPLERAAAPAAAPEPWDAMRDRPARRQSEIHVRFGSTEEPRAPGRRWVAVGAVMAVMMMGFGGVYGLYSTDVTGAIGRAFTTSASASPAAGAEPLQLLSLKHVTDETGTFVLTGLVQNPAAGRPLRDVVAVVYLFDQQGRYFTGGKTGLELTSFHPGDESPFVVKVSGATGVSRYRIGFRMEDGGVVAHVDRRGQLPGGTVEDAAVDDDRATALPLPRRSEG